MENLPASDYWWPLGVLLTGTIASLGGGALTGLALGARDLGPNLAALMGAFFGPLAGASGLTLGLFALALFGVRAS